MRLKANLKKILVSFLLILPTTIFSQNPYFAINAIQDTVVITQGQVAIFNITGTPFLGFNSTLFLSSTSTPCSLDMGFSQPSFNSPYTNSTLSINNTSASWPDTLDILIKAENGTFQAFDTCHLVILPDTAMKWAVFTPSNSGLQFSFADIFALDKSGYDIWFIQNGGPNSAFARHNGYSWETRKATGEHIITDNCGNIHYDSTENNTWYTNMIPGFYADNNKLWLGMTGNILCIDKNTMTQIYDTSIVIPLTPPSSCIITKDTANNIWVGAIDGLYKYNNNYWKRYDYTNSYLPNDIIRAIAIDQNNKLWIGSVNNGLYCFDGIFWNSYTTTNSNLISNQITRIVIGNNNEPIISTQNGICKFNGINFDTVATLGYAVAVQADTNKIWYGERLTTGSGINSFDGVSSTPVVPINNGIQIADFTTLTIYEMIRDSLNNIWIGTSGGIFVYNSEGLSALFNLPRVLYNTTSTVAIHEHTVQENENYIFPNPTNDKCTLRMSFEKQEFITIQVMDSKGITLKNNTIKTNIGYQEYTIDLSNYAAGVYYVTTFSNSFRKTQKIIISK